MKQLKLVKKITFCILLVIVSIAIYILLLSVITKIMFRDDGKIKNMYDIEYEYYTLLNDVADNSIKDGLIDFKKIPEDRVGYNFEKCGENVKIIYYIKDFETIYNINVDLNTATNSYEKKCSFEVSDYNEYKVQYISGIEKIVKIVLIVILFFIMFIIICKCNYIFI